MEKENQYEIPNSNLRRLMESNDNDFILTIKFENESNEEKQINIETTLNKARVISNNINKLYQIDPTINHYEINIPKAFKKVATSAKEVMDLIIKSASEKVELPKEKSNLFIIILFLLGEEEQSGLNIKIQNVEEALSLLNTNFHSQSIEYLSGHLLEFLQNHNFRSVSEEIILEIIDLYFEHQISEKESENENMKFQEKKQIFQILKEQNEDSSIIFHFLLNIDSNEYDEEMINYVYNNIDDEIITKEMPKIISRIKKDLKKLIEINKKQNNKSETKGKLIDCNFNGDELSGIISYLCKSTNDYSGNTAVKLSCSGNQQSSLANIIKYDRNNVYINSYDKSDNWIKFDFGERKINLSSYTIRTNHCIQNNCAYPKTWKIYGSNDGENWDEIDIRTNNSELNGRYHQKRFECQNSNKFYKYIKYIQDESWHNRSYCKYKIKLTCIEFFGTIIEN